MQKRLFLKPIRSQTKAIILEDAHLLTLEAQNALLKVLEEPPEHTIIILSTENKDILLPTVVSRCQIIELQKEKPELTQEDIREISFFIEQVSKLKTGDQLKRAETLAKDKDEILLWLEKTIIVAREKLMEVVEKDVKKEQYYLHLLQSFQQAYKLLKTTNVNPRFLLESTLLNLIS